MQIKTMIAKIKAVKDEVKAKLLVSAIFNMIRDKRYEMIKMMKNRLRYSFITLSKCDCTSWFPLPLILEAI